MSQFGRPCRMTYFGLVDMSTFFWILHVVQSFLHTQTQEKDGIRKRKNVLQQGRCGPARGEVQEGTDFFTELQRGKVFAFVTPKLYKTCAAPTYVEVNTAKHPPEWGVLIPSCMVTSDGILLFLNRDESENTVYRKSCPFTLMLIPSMSVFPFRHKVCACVIVRVINGLQWDQIKAEFIWINSKA